MNTNKTSEVSTLEPVIGLESGNCTHLEHPASNASRIAVAVLAFCCVCWGFSFPVVKAGTRAFVSHFPRNDAIGSLPPLLEMGIGAAFNGCRFALASILYWLITRQRQRAFQRSEVHGGMMVGTFFSLGILCQLIGLRYTLPSISAFLTSLVVVFAPVAQSLFFRHRIRSRIWIAVGVALLGVTVLSQPNPDAATQPVNVTLFPYMGEILTTLGSLFFTAQLLALDYYGPRADSTRLTLIMFITTAATSGFIGMICAGGELMSSATLRGCITDPVLVGALISTAVFCSVVALHLMNAYQPQVSASTASVIYCLEPLFATFFSVAFGTESLTSVTAIGGALILFAVVLVARM